MGAFNPLKSNAHISACICLGLGRLATLKRCAEKCLIPPKCQNCGAGGNEEGRPIPHLITQKWKLGDYKEALLSNKRGNQHPIQNQKRKARLLSHTGSIRSAAQFASQVKKGSFILITYHQWKKGCRPGRHLLDLLNTEGFCKGNRTCHISQEYILHPKESEIPPSSLHIYTVRTTHRALRNASGLYH